MNKLGKKIISILLLVLGLFLITYGLIRYNRDFVSYQDRVYTTAVVLEVKGFEANFDSTHRVAAIEYDVNGEDMSSEINYHSVIFRSGDTITIYYDKNHPERVSSDTADYIMFFIILSGIVSTIIGILFMVKKTKKKKRA